MSNYNRRNSNKGHDKPPGLLEVMERLEKLESSVLDSSGGGLLADMRKIEERQEQLQKNLEEKVHEISQIIDEFQGKLKTLGEVVEKMQSSPKDENLYSEGCRDVLLSIGEVLKKYSEEVRKDGMKYLKEMKNDGSGGTDTECAVSTTVQMKDTIGKEHCEELLALAELPMRDNFIKDSDDRAVVYVKVKLLKVKKQTKGAAIGIWWAASHDGNRSFLTKGKTSENLANLRAVTELLETALKFKVQKVCVLSSSKYIIDKMMKDGAVTANDKSDASQDTDETNAFDYIKELTTWFYDIKWCYVDGDCILPGMQDATKLMESALKNEAKQT